MAKSTVKKTPVTDYDDFYQIKPSPDQNYLTDAEIQTKPETFEFDLGEIYNSLSSKSSFQRKKAVDETLLYPFQADFDPDVIKEANRSIIRRLPAETKKALLAEHKALVSKKYGDGLSQKEERRLKLVRWELDRFEDAEIGEEIDFIEAFTEVNDQFSSEIRELLDKLGNSVSSHRSKKRKRP